MAQRARRLMYPDHSVELADIYTQLDALRIREVQTISHRPRRELFHWPLGLGLLVSFAYHLVWAVNTGLRRKPVLPTMSGPTWQREPSPFADDEAALLIAVEVTPTMLAQDIQPSRLERAAQKIHDLQNCR